MAKENSPDNYENSKIDSLESHHEKIKFAGVDVSVRIFTDKNGLQAYGNIAGAGRSVSIEKEGALNLINLGPIGIDLELKDFTPRVESYHSICFRIRRCFIIRFNGRVIRKCWYGPWKCIPIYYAIDDFPFDRALPLVEQHQHLMALSTSAGADECHCG